MLKSKGSLSPQDKSLVEAFLEAGGVVQVCKPGRARSRSSGSWDRLNDQSRAARGLVTG